MFIHRDKRNSQKFLLSQCFLPYVSESKCGHQRLPILKTKASMAARKTSQHYQCIVPAAIADEFCGFDNVSHAFNACTVFVSMQLFQTFQWCEQELNFHSWKTTDWRQWCHACASHAIRSSVSCTSQGLATTVKRQIFTLFLVSRLLRITTAEEQWLHWQ